MKMEDRQQTLSLSAPRTSQGSACPLCFCLDSRPLLASTMTRSGMFIAISRLIKGGIGLCVSVAGWLSRVGRTDFAAIVSDIEGDKNFRGPFCVVDLETRIDVKRATSF